MVMKVSTCSALGAEKSASVAKASVAAAKEKANHARRPTWSMVNAQIRVPRRPTACVINPYRSDTSSGSLNTVRYNVGSQIENPMIGRDDDEQVRTARLEPPPDLVEGGRQPVAVVARHRLPIPRDDRPA